MSLISIIGTVGIPASYGGFETLVEHLARYHQTHSVEGRLAVYCSSNSYKIKSESYLGAQLHFIRLNANGISSILYDIISLISAVRRRSNVILVLGVSGAICLPFIRLLSRAHIVTNIDGLEWKREKWNRVARWFLKFSEQIAVNFSHVVIADNQGIADYIKQSYGRKSHMVAYGGDHVLQTPPKPYEDRGIPSSYALALCRIEPENNVEMILEAFTVSELPLVFLGNWNNSSYGRKMREHYTGYSSLYLLDPIYDVGVLRTLRENASIYVHGHSAGGTNPSLVEMMHFGLPILAYDCIYNRFTTEDKAIFFKDTFTLRNVLESLLNSDMTTQIGIEMYRVAQERYTWDAVGRSYFDILLPK